MVFCFVSPSQLYITYRVLESHLLIRECGFLRTLSIDDGIAAFVDLYIFIESLICVHCVLTVP